MKERNEERAIYLKDLIFVVLYQWKKLLIVAVALAVLLGGFKCVTGIINLNNPATLEAITKQNQIQLERYEAESNALEQQIETLRSQIRKQQEYLNNSLLMQLEPYEFYETTLAFYIETDYQILPGMEYQNPDRIQAIIHSYVSLLMGSECLQAMAEQLDTEPQYLSEMLTVKGDHGTCLLHITARAANVEQAQKLSGLLLEQFKQQNKHISTSVDSHRYTIVEQSTRQVFDLALAEQQNAQNAHLAYLLTSQTNAQAAQQELKAPSLQTGNIKEVIKDTILFAIVGGVLAVFLYAVVLWCGYIASSKVYSRRTLENRTGIKCLGAMPADGSDPITTKLRSWDGRTQNTKEDQAAILAAMIRNISGNASRLLVTGDVSAEDRVVLLDAISKAMPGVRIDNAEDILRSVAALDDLAASDAVLLLAQCQHSRYQDINSRIELICNHNKPMLGCILFGG